VWLLEADEKPPSLGLFLHARNGENKR